MFGFRVASAVLGLAFIVCLPSSVRSQDVDSIIEPDWKAEFQEAYGLSEGENVRFVLAPIPESRGQFWRSTRSDHSIGDPDTMVLVVDNDGEPVGWFFNYGGPGSVGDVVKGLGTDTSRIDVEKSFLVATLPGDLVVRQGVPVSQLLEEMAAVWPKPSAR